MVIPPYAPSFRWYAEWARGLASGLSDMEAIAWANASLHVGGKDFARCVIGGNNGPATLSVPVAGGSHSLLRRGAELSATLSEHGNWRHIHSSALEAVYGRTPFFQHLMPDIKSVLKERQTDLAALNVAIHRVMADFLSFPFPNTALTEAAEERARELAREIDVEKSMLDALMRLGRDVALPLAWLIFPQESALTGTTVRNEEKLWLVREIDEGTIL